MLGDVESWLEGLAVGQWLGRLVFLSIDTPLESLFVDLWVKQLVGRSVDL